MRRLLCLTFLAALLAATPAAADTFTVTTTNDNDKPCAASCSLRSALAAAAGTVGTDVVLLPAAVYPLDSTFGQLEITSSVELRGDGAQTTRIVAATGRRVLVIKATATLRGVTLTGANITGAGEVSGGGVLISGGDVTLDRVAVRDSKIASPNIARGAGIAAMAGTLTLTDSTVSGNQAIGRVNAQGGSAVGGGIYSDVPLTILRSTIAQNQTQNGVTGQYSQGGGVYAAGKTTISHATIAQNSSVGVSGIGGFQNGGNLFVSSSTEVSLGSSVLAAGLAGSNSGAGQDCRSDGTLTETAENLSSSPTVNCGTPVIADAKLTPLGPNGGPTETMLPGPGSPARDAAVGCGARPADQRGNALPAGPACDLGAVELGADRSVTLQVAKASAAAGEDVLVSATIANAGLDDAAGETLTFDLPEGVTATTATSTLGTCTVGAPVVCTLGTLSRGVTASIIFTVRGAGASGPITARRGGPLPDQNAANDRVSSGSVTWAAASASGGGSTGAGTPPAGTPADRIAPVVGGLKVSARRGATLRFTLSEAASVRIVTERVVRRRGAKPRYVRVATTSAQRAAGAVTVKVPAKALRRGRMRFTVVATDAAGNASAARRALARISR